METNRYTRRLDEVRGRADFLDLIDSRFHHNGFVPPAELFQQTFQDFLYQRQYEPDPKGFGPARQRVAQWYRDQDLAADPDRLFFTAGTSEAYHLLFGRLAKPGDRVLLPRPGYPLFEFLAGFNHLEIAFYDLDPDNQFRPDLASVQTQLNDRTRLLVLITPNNPTGAVIPADDLRQLGQLLEPTNCVLISDEVFDTFAWGPFARPAAVLPHLPVFTLNGISKMFASPDFKLSWILATGPAARMHAWEEDLETANDIFLSCNSFSQFLLPRLFDGLTLFCQGMKADLAANRQALLTESAAWSDWGVRLVPPGGGIHFALKLPSGQDEATAISLLERGLAVHPGYFYDFPEAENWLVLSLLKQPADFTAGLMRLTEAFRHLLV